MRKAGGIHEQGEPCFLGLLLPGGRQNLDDFRGFAMRRTDPTVSKGGQPKRERAPRRADWVRNSTTSNIHDALSYFFASRKPRQISNISDIELIKMDSSKEGKVGPRMHLCPCPDTACSLGMDECYQVTLAFFDAFESRSAGKDL